jgi:biotin--protein ligase
MNMNMNVLVYSGPGTTKPCVDQCLETFRLLLSPYYSVSTVNEKVLLHQPWESKTAILIIPGGADLPICKLFKDTINERIKKYVNKGGKFIGICSGSYFASARCEFEVGNPDMEVSGPRELKFFPGTCRGGVVKGFNYGTERGTRALEVAVNSKILPGLAPSAHLYVNGGGVFVDAHKYANVQILATYADELDVEDGIDGKKAAVILSTVGRGKALLFGPHAEFSPNLLTSDPDLPSFSQVVKCLKATNKTRMEFLRAALKTLDIKVNEKAYERPKLTPLYLVSLDNTTASSLIDKIENELGYQIQNIIDIGQDKLAVHKSCKYPNNSISFDAPEDPQLAIKNLYLCDNDLPPSLLTPYFDINKFKNHFIEFYKSSNQELTSESIGNTFAYGEVVTSTSALMDSNYKWLPLLPSGFTITGTIQVLGKGRSGNHWVNPKGVLPVSSLVKIPKRCINVAPLVFVQYLSSMAYTRALLEYDEGYNELPVKIKWPNDIYIKLPQYIGKEIDKSSKEITHVKIGGILVNTNLFDDQYYLIIGAGLNVSNEAPTTSVNAVIETMNIYYKSVGSDKHLEPLSEEKLLAKYLTIFNEMIEKFKYTGFKPFLKDYYNLWFHSNQIVTLNDKGGLQAQICGITPDWGMLMAKDLKTGNMFELQPDGNSFDMFNGLISQKR